MKKSKEVNISPTFIIISFLLGLITGLIITATFQDDCSLPNRNEIFSFCQEHGYNYGFIGNQCSENEVVCADNSKNFECIEWEWSK